MSVQCAARFTPPPPVEPTAGLSASGRTHGSSARRGLGTGTVLLLTGGAVATSWAVPASAHAQVEAPAPDEQRENAGDLPAQSPRTAAGSPVSPLWGAATAPGAADDPSSSTRPLEETTPGAGPLDGAPMGPGALDAAPTGPATTATAESAPTVHASEPQTSPERIQDRLAQATLVLRSGESLWSLTGQLLGPEASPAQIARSWPLLWEANADQIRDPDQVSAGTVLQVPPQLLPEQ